ncbi:MAG: D-tyrosyl-tRNA(Tyr) deacylase [Calditrichaeota bacterium]|nr:D-tyrosyl-tRNA(Tyr) deacylase [Calditrichota bacterium]
MKAVVQRVREASVEVDGQVVGAIGHGLVVLLGVGVDDEPADADYLAEKIVQLRIFNDEAGKMNRSLMDVKGGMLAISQFTLYASTRKGRRPSFVDAAPPEKAEPMYEYFIQKVQEKGVPVEKGIFGAMMLVKIFNDGPVTILIDSKDRLKPRRAKETE